MIDRATTTLRLLRTHNPILQSGLVSENRGVLGSIPSLAISKDAGMWAGFAAAGEVA
jgi:hypothetical protein